MARKRPDTDEVLDPLPLVVSRGSPSGDHDRLGSLEAKAHLFPENHLRVVRIPDSGAASNRG